MLARFFGPRAVVSTTVLIRGTGIALALDVPSVRSKSAAQSEQRVNAGFDASLAEGGKTDWTVNLLDRGGSGEATASNVEDAARRFVDEVIITMADLRASRAAIDAAGAANTPIFAVDHGYVEGIVDITTNNRALSSNGSPICSTSRAEPAAPCSRGWPGTMPSARATT